MDKAQNGATVAMFIIVNAGHADEVIAMAREAGAKGATIFNARGSAPNHRVFLGITIDTEKEIVLCLLDSDTASRVMTVIKERAGAGTKAHGVCFTLPVENIIGLTMPDD